jgi:hypothetical protein
VAIPKPEDHHTVVTVTKSGSTNFTIPWDASVYDTLFWIKRRDSAGTWYQIDGLRGYTKILHSDTTAAETTDANVLSVSGTTGTLGSTLTDGTYVIQMWKAGLTASRQTNTDGSITSTVSRNVTSGFAIVTYTGTAANATVGHGLSSAPKMLIAKGRTNTENWPMWHTSFTSGSYYMYFNGASQEALDATKWNGSPTSSVFNIGTGINTNATGVTFVAYCFAEITGYSKFGKYVGNASTDGPFVACGFSRKWGLLKRIDGGTEAWSLYDTVRDTYNVETKFLGPHLSDAETTVTSGDTTANGFKLRTASSPFNTTGAIYIFADFAKFPFGGNNVSPSPAR